jgi:hypothetical protein
MTEDAWTRAQIAILIYGVTNAVLFGTGIVFVLSVPVLSANAGLLIPLVVAASFILAAPITWTITWTITWEIAARLRARYWRGRSQRT